MPPYWCNLKIVTCFSCLLGMLLLLSFKANRFAHALKSTRVLRTFKAEYPEMERALSDPRWVEDTMRKLTAMSSSLSFSTEADKLIQLGDYYLPVFKYVDALLQHHRSVDSRKPLFVGVSAPQVGLPLSALADMCLKYACVEGFALDLWNIGLWQDHHDQRNLRCVQAGRKVLRSHVTG
jgi:hypothetical protein